MSLLLTDEIIFLSQKYLNNDVDSYLKPDQISTSMVLTLMYVINLIIKLLPKILATHLKLFLEKNLDFFYRKRKKLNLKFGKISESDITFIVFWFCFFLSE